MWRLTQVCHKASRLVDHPEQLRLKRREQEKVLRQARRDRQLFSKRLLLNDDEDQPGVITDISGEQDVVSLFHKLHSGSEEKEAILKALSRALRNPSAQTTFIKLKNSMHLLVGLLTCSNTGSRLQAVRCLHELSHSPHTTVAPACLPSTPYLLTYLSGQSTKFTELCLYTLGNLCAGNYRVKETLLSQGVIPALVSCVENQKHNLALVTAVGFTLSQLLQATDAADRTAQMVLVSSLPSHLLSVLSPDPQFGLAPVIEVAWCLHYLICSTEDNGVLLSHGALLKCSTMLVTISGDAVEGNKEEGLELLVWPLLRCVGNLLSSYPLEQLSTQEVDVGLPAALCALLRVYLQTQPALARETAWVLNNLTARSTELCSALLTLNLVPGLIKLLPFSQGINTLILRVVANIAHRQKDFCDQLTHFGLLSALCATLKMVDTEMVALSLDVLYVLIESNSQVEEEFVKQGGLSLIEAIQYSSEGGLRRRASYLLEHKLINYSH